MKSLKKSLHFLALSMFVSSPYALQASTTDSTNQLPPLLTRQAPSNSQISPIGDNLTTANVGAYMTNIGNTISSMPTSPTNDQLITLQQSFENVKNALLKLFPQMKEFRKTENQKNGEYRGQGGDYKQQGRGQGGKQRQQGRGQGGEQRQQGRGQGGEQRQQGYHEYGSQTTPVIPSTTNSVVTDNTTQIQS